MTGPEALAFFAWTSVRGPGGPIYAECILAAANLSKLVLLPTHAIGQGSKKLLHLRTWRPVQEEGAEPSVTYCTLLAPDHIQGPGWAICNNHSLPEAVLSNGKQSLKLEALFRANKGKMLALPPIEAPKANLLQYFNNAAAAAPVAAAAAGCCPAAAATMPPGAGAGEELPPAAEAEHPPGPEAALPPGTEAALPPGTEAALPAAEAALPPGTEAALPAAEAALPPGTEAALPAAEAESPPASGNSGASCGSGISSSSFGVHKCPGLPKSLKKLCVRPSLQNSEAGADKKAEAEAEQKLQGEAGQQEQMAHRVGQSRQEETHAKAPQVEGEKEKGTAEDKEAQVKVRDGTGEQPDAPEDRHGQEEEEQGQQAHAEGEAPAEQEEAEDQGERPQADDEDGVAAEEDDEEEQGELEHDEDVAPSEQEDKEDRGGQDQGEEDDGDAAEEADEEDQGEDHQAATAEEDQETQGEEH